MIIIMQCIKFSDLITHCALNFFYTFVPVARSTAIVIPCESLLVCVLMVVCVCILPYSELS